MGYPYYPYFHKDEINYEYFWKFANVIVDIYQPFIKDNCESYNISFTSDITLEKSTLCSEFKFLVQKYEYWK